MGRKGPSKHVKRHKSPSFWPVNRKEKVWAKGDYFSEEARMKDEELEAKFRINAAKVLSQENIDNAVRAIFELEKMGDISELLAILSSQG